MNSISAIALICFLMTLWSAGVLFFSFKSSIDISGGYFLLAEFLMLLVLIQIFVTNYRPELITTKTLMIGNLVGISSEIAIFFSIYSLTRSVKVWQYLLSICFTFIYWHLSHSKRT